jgi:hypothetical protein
VAGVQAHGHSPSPGATNARSAREVAPPSPPLS